MTGLVRHLSMTAEMRWLILQREHRSTSDPWSGPRAFRSRVPHGRVEVFDRSAHFVQFEQAEEYSALVTAFVLERRSA